MVQEYFIGKIVNRVTANAREGILEKDYGIFCFNDKYWSRVGDGLIFVFILLPIVVIGVSLVTPIFFPFWLIGFFTERHFKTDLGDKAELDRQEQERIASE